MSKKLLAQKDFTNIPLLNVVLQQLASDPTDVTAKIYYNTTSNTIRFFNGTVWGSVGGTGVTNLTFSRDGTTVTVESSSGSNAVLPAATTSLAGVMSGADKTKLDGLTSLSLGAAYRIPIMNAGADDFQYLSNFSYNTTYGAIESNFFMTDGIGEGFNVFSGGTLRGGLSVVGDSKPRLNGVLGLHIESPQTQIENARSDNTPAEIEADAASAFITKDWFNTYVGTSGTNTGDEVTATDAIEGIAEIATQGEVDAGTEGGAKFVTPLTLQAKINAAIVSSFTDKGNYDATANTPDLDVAPSGIKKGDVYYVSVAGDLFAETLEVGDVIRALQDDPVDAGDWAITQTNLTPATIKSQLLSNADTNVVTDTELAILQATSGTNTGDQAAGDFNHDDLANITGTPGELNHPTDAEMVVLGNTSGNNTGDEVTATESVEGIAEIATQGEVDTGSEAGAKFVTPATLQSKLGVSATLLNVVKFETTIGNGALTDFTITHNIGRQFVKATVIRNSAPYDEVEVEVECDSTTACGITGFVVAPTTDEFKVIIMG